MKRIALTALLAVVCFLGTPQSAYAAEPGTTGKANACARHAMNKGESLAKGLECAAAPTLTVGTFTVQGEVTCIAPVTGAGLLVGSDVILTDQYGEQVVIATVGSDGTVNDTLVLFDSETAVLTGTTASGESITTGVITVEC